MAKTPIAKDEAFGIIPILAGKTPYQYLLIQHHAGHWGFPKGHADPGESAFEAACREFLEETGIAEYTVLDEVTFSEEYMFSRQGQKFTKTVLYFPAMVQSTVVKCQQEEIRAYTWATYETAIDLITFDGGKQVLKDAHQYLLQRFPS